MILLNDETETYSTPFSDEFEFSVNDEDHAVIGIRPHRNVDFNLDLYSDTTYSTILESSYEPIGEVDFIAIDKNVLAGPPNRGAIVSAVSGIGGYHIEMENNVPDYSIGDIWSGSMNASVGGPVLAEGPAAWDDTTVTEAAVIFENGIYHMWYAGNDHTSWENWEIGYANSTDGLYWIKYINNPVLTLGPNGAWDDIAVGAPTVLYLNGIFHMWYVGVDGSVNRIGYANSTDGLSWNKYPGNPVLDIGPWDSWEDNIISGPKVIYNGTGFEMWYQGHDGIRYRIGRATSYDGLLWNKYVGNPVLNIGPADSWDDVHVSASSVLFDGLTYRMWYSGYNGSNFRIGYATSSDGITWSKYGFNPVLVLGEPDSWDDAHVANPMVLYNGTEYQMWFTGIDGSIKRIGFARSSDGFKWMKIMYSNEVLDAYEISDLTSGSYYSGYLEVPMTIDLDFFIFDTTGGKNDAIASSTNNGQGVDEFISFTAPITGDYLLVITNEDKGYGTYSISTYCNLIVSGIPGVVNDVFIGETNILMECLTLSSEANQAIISGISLEVVGNVVDADIENVYLYNDADDNGILDPSDILLDTTSPISGTLTFGSFSFPVFPGIAENLLLIIDISQTASIGKVLGLTIEKAEDITMATPGTVRSDNFPIISEFITIKGGKITGFVEDIGGFPIEGGIVQLLLSTQDMIASYITESSGAFGFENLSYNSYILNASSEGYGYNNSVYGTVSSVNPVQDVGIIKLTPIPELPVTTGKISGRVVDEENASIEGAVVQLADDQNVIITMWVTDSLGKFEFPDIAFGTYDITVSVKGFEDNDSVSGGITSDNPILDVGDIVLSQIDEPQQITTGTVEFYIYDTDQNVVQDAKIKLLNVSDEDVGLWGMTDSNGSLKFENVTFGIYSIEISCDGYITQFGEEFNLDLKNHSLTIVSSITPTPLEPNIPKEKESIPWWLSVVLILLMATILILLYLIINLGDKEEDKLTQRAQEEPPLNKEMSSEEPPEDHIPPTSPP
jgi:predicted GH43/DUF377 family glycosyl hydrolase